MMEKGRRRALLEKQNKETTWVVLSVSHTYGVDWRGQNVLTVKSGDINFIQGKKKGKIS